MRKWEVNHKKGLFVSWKVDRVLANQRLNLTAGTEITSNVPKAWIIIEDLPPGRKGQWHPWDNSLLAFILLGTILPWAQML